MLNTTTIVAISMNYTATAMYFEPPCGSFKVIQCMHNMEMGMGHQHVTKTPILCKVMTDCKYGPKLFGRLSLCVKFDDSGADQIQKFSI